MGRHAREWAMPECSLNRVCARISDLVLGWHRKVAPLKHLWQGCWKAEYMEAALKERLQREAAEIIEKSSSRDPASLRFVDVLFAYRLLLQRPPEFSDALAYKSRVGDTDLRAMVGT